MLEGAGTASFSQTMQRCARLGLFATSKQARASAWNADTWALTNRVTADLAQAAGTSALGIRSLGEQQREIPQNAIQSRWQQREKLSISFFKLVGVTFDGRQEVLKRMEPDDAVMFLKEPWNVHDPNAVRVRLIDGSDCGFISREYNHLFLNDIHFGHVQSVGRAQDRSEYGAMVKLRLLLPPLCVDAIPKTLASWSNLRVQLGPSRWEDLCRDALRRSGFRCEVSGVEGKPLECHELWSFDEGGHVMRFAGLQCLSEDIHRARHILEEQDEKRRQESMWLLQAMNEWTPAEAESYLRYTRRIAEERSKKPWRLDLSYLGEDAPPLPPEVLVPSAYPPTPMRRLETS